jgi:hypothetical protein
VAETTEYTYFTLCGLIDALAVLHCQPGGPQAAKLLQLTGRADGGGPGCTRGGGGDEGSEGDGDGADAQLQEMLYGSGEVGGGGVLGDEEPDGGAPKARSHRRFAPPPIHFIIDSLI